MSLYIVDIHGDIEGDYEIVKKYEEPRKGRWIKSRDCYGNNHFTCPFCGHDIATKADIWDDNYCSNCGAKLVEPQESEDIYGKFE